MPTNPLWIEHTEKAAWETVRALREQVEEERARSDRLIALEPTLPRVVELIDAVREELGLESEAPVVAIEQLLERLRAMGQERERLREELAARSAPSAQVSAPAPSEPKSSPRKPSALRWFVGELDRHRREQEEAFVPRGATLAEVASRVDERLRAMLPLPFAPRALRRAALDLGVSALELARAARRAERT